MGTNFKVGDRVLLKNKRGEYWNGYGEMDKYKGQVVTIKKMNGEKSFSIEEDDGEGWLFEMRDIEKKIESFSIDDLKFADIMTLRNGERYVYSSGCMYGEEEEYYNDSDDIEYLYNDNLTSSDRDDKEWDIVKVERNGEVIFDRNEEVKEMTLAEVCKELGYNVKIVKEEE